MLDALLHTLLQEFGYAIVDIYHLPIVEREEDAVDDLVTILLIEYFEGGKEISTNAVYLFKLESESLESLENKNLWREHSLDIQRFYRMM